MTIKITNLGNGKQILVKNQDDMNRLKNTSQDNSFFKNKPTSANFYTLNDFDSEDKEDYINRFSFFNNDEEDLANPTTDVYYNDVDNDQNDNEDDRSTQIDSQDQNNLSDEEASQEPSSDDPDYQGNIRTVTGAELVYKRQDQNGTYDELWILTIGKDAEAENNIRKSILSGTAIDPNTQQSDDGTQNASTTTMGNIQFIEITGLPQ